MSELLPKPVATKVRCRTSQAPGAPSTGHEVVIETDGSISTGHDLATERIAAAMGGYLSCLDLVDTVQPALQFGLRIRRRELPRALAQTGQSWRPRSRCSACPSAGYTSPAEAFYHACDPGHWALLHGAPSRTVRRLARLVAESEPRSPAEEPAATLWSWGIHPDRMLQIQGALGEVGELPPEFYLLVEQHRPKLAWLAHTLAGGSASSDTVCWLAQSYTAADRADQDLRRRWIGLQIPPRLIVALTKAGYSPEFLSDLAEKWRRTPAGTAVALHRWVDRGFRPQLAQLVSDWIGPESRPASAATLQRLRRALPQGANDLSDLDLALLVLEHGDLSHAAAAAHSASVSPLASRRETC